LTVFQAAMRGEDPLDEMFLRTLSRRPTDEERASAREALAAAGDQPSALVDLFWALVNPPEVVTNPSTRTICPRPLARPCTSFAPPLSRNRRKQLARRHAGRPAARRFDARPRAAGTRDDPRLARRRTGHDRHVGPQARGPARSPGRIQVDRHGAAGYLGQR